ncbi:hypothetical protein PMIN01_02658 [Paraphaeosphaeria minitans]|uniref:Uncharacterized protein n=1 Tax=Paraphaeosphaeria minitans TaxID=565426 RepID=A0A9P6GRQ9_9PLEO|nr:hypothetical protein PMIN01_02658 [Paraphaeosphaeria minitans]
MSFVLCKAVRPTTRTAKDSVSVSVRIYGLQRIPALQHPPSTPTNTFLATQSSTPQVAGRSGTLGSGF